MQRNDASRDDPGRSSDKTSQNPKRVRAVNLIGGQCMHPVLSMLVPFFDQMELSAEGTFPWIVTESGINLILQKSLAWQAPHGSSAAGAT